jgi:hypothetical protein
MLERDAVAWRPFTGQDAALDVEPDPLVQRRLVGRLELVAIDRKAHATSLCTVLLNASRAVSRSR